jgi:hypothetical protein
MVMSERTSNDKRAGARGFGVIFQLLAVASLVGTLVAMAYVANLGTQIGINGTKDPLTWIVLASGLFVTCVLTGIGYILGILCAIYDRQEPAKPVVDVVPRTITRSYSPEPAWYRPSPMTLATEEKPAPTPPVNRVASPLPQPPAKPSAPQINGKSSSWEWLTRERHFRQPESD